MQMRLLVRRKRGTTGFQDLRLKTRLLKQRVRAADVDEAMLSREMLTGGTVCPDPDLLVRTSGERRLSNFLLWQVAYSEMIFVEKHWPAMKREDLAEVVREFSRRKRRFGK